MGALLVAAIALWVLTRNLFDEAEASNADLPSLGALAMTQFVFVALTGALAVWEAWRYSHRVIGPAHRIAASLRRLRGGDTDFRVELRKGDELQAIVDELNPLLEELARKGTAGSAAAAGTEAPAPVGAAHGD